MSLESFQPALLDHSQQRLETNCSQRISHGTLVQDAAWKVFLDCKFEKHFLLLVIL